MNKLLAILPLIAVVFAMGTTSMAYAQFGDHDITTDENISENPAIAPRAVSPLNSYGYDNTKPYTGNNSIVCGDHLCADGEQPPRLYVDGDYSRGD